MPLDISNDFKIFDGLEAVQVIQAGTAKEQRINNALQFGVNTRDAIGSNGTYTQGDVKFNLAAKECTVFKPQAGDFIKTKEGDIWTIGTVEYLTLKTRFQCWGKKVDLNPNLSVVVKVYRPLSGKDEAGAPRTAWKLWKELAAHINENASAIEITEGRRRVKVTHQIYFTEQIDIQAGYRVTTPDGSAWGVARVTAKGNLGSAVVCDVEAARTPTVD